MTATERVNLTDESGSGQVTCCILYVVSRALMILNGTGKTILGVVLHLEDPDETLSRDRSATV